LASTPTAPALPTVTSSKDPAPLSPEPGAIAAQRAGAYPVSFLYNPGPYQQLVPLCRGVIGIVLTFDTPRLVSG